MPLSPISDKIQRIICVKTKTHAPNLWDYSIPVGEIFNAHPQYEEDGITLCRWWVYAKDNPNALKYNLRDKGTCARPDQWEVLTPLKILKERISKHLTENI